MSLRLRASFLCFSLLLLGLCSSEMGVAKRHTSGTWKMHQTSGGQYQYQYAGSPFSDFSGTPSVNGSDSMAITIVLSQPLAPNSALGVIQPVSAQISDGVNTFTLNDDMVVEVEQTDSNGAIVQWLVYGLPNSSEFPTLLSECDDNSSLDFVDEGPNNDDPPTEDEAQVAANPYGWLNPNSPDPGKGLGAPTDTSGADAVGEPINISNGNVYDSVIDYQTAGPNRLSLIRYYNSQSTVEVSIVGLGGWRTNFDRYLSADQYGRMEADRPDGQRLLFYPKHGGWVGSTDVTTTLRQSGSTFTLTDIHGNIETYHVAGGNILLQSIRASNGYLQTLSFAKGAFFPDQVADSYGRKLTFSYASGSLFPALQEVVTPDGTTIVYALEASGTTGSKDRLHTVTHSGPASDTSTTTYVYEDAAFPFAMTGIVDGLNQRFQTWAYDNAGRAISNASGAGVNTTGIVYDDSDGSRTVTNALGQVEKHKYRLILGLPRLVEIDRIASTNVPAATETFTYDSNGFLSTAKDWKGTTVTNVNDQLGRAKTSTVAGGGLTRETTYTYLGQTDIVATKSEPGLDTSYTFDSLDDIATKTETDRTTTTSPYTTAGTTRTWKYSYSAFAVHTIQSPRTDLVARTTFNYTNGILTSTVDALTHAITVTSYTPGGYPLEAVDANGVTTSYAYDNQMRLVSESVAGNLTTYVYDLAGNLIKIGMPDGTSVTKTYDTAHRLVRDTTPSGNYEAYRLDSMGNVLEKAIFNSSGEKFKDSFSSYDFLGRKLTDTGSSGQVTTYAYDNDGNRTVQKWPRGASQTTSYDGLNRAAFMIDRTGHKTVFVYDLENRLLEVDNAIGGRTTFVYDGFGEPIYRSSPDSGAVVMTYDGDGNLSSRRDSNGITANFRYDALDRPLTERFPNASDDAEYTYDATGSSNGIGRLTNVVDAAGSLAIGYDARGNVSAQTRKIGAKTLTTRVTWDGLNRPYRITYPSGISVTYLRDKDGQLSSIVVVDTGFPSRYVWHSATHEPMGPLGAVAYGNGIVETRNYDGDYRLKTLVCTGAKPDVSLKIGYDNDNNILGESDLISASNGRSFAFDGSDRISVAEGTFGRPEYTYDAIGNRYTVTTSSGTATYNYFPDSSRLQSISGGSDAGVFSYDNAGRVTALGSNLILGYTQTGRLASVKSGTKYLLENLYDYRGYRLQKSDVDGTVYYSYGPTGRLLEEVGATTQDIIYSDDGRPVAAIDAKSGSLYMVLCNEQGAPIKAYDSNQDLVWLASYNPSGGAATAGPLSLDLRLPGQIYDAETGWCSNGVRDYDPELGRYLEPDPIGLESGLGAYTFAGDNTLSFSDPKGTDSVIDGPGAFGAGAITGGMVGYCPGVFAGDDSLQTVADYAAAGSNVMTLASSMSDVTLVGLVGNQCSLFSTEMSAVNWYFDSMDGDSEKVLGDQLSTGLGVAGLLGSVMATPIGTGVALVAGPGISLSEFASNHPDLAIASTGMTTGAPIGGNWPASGTPYVLDPHTMQPYFPGASPIAPNSGLPSYIQGGFVAGRP